MVEKSAIDTFGGAQSKPFKTKKEVPPVISPDQSRTVLPDQKQKPSFSAVLQSRAFRSLWLGQIFSQTAVSVTMFVLALRIYEITGSSTAVSGLYLTFGISAFLFAMAAGAVVDRFDKRTILIFCDLIRAVLSLGFLLGNFYLPILYLIALIYAMISQFYTPSEAPMIPHLVSPKVLVTANSVFTFTFYSSLAIGSLLAGPILRLVGPFGIFPLISFFFLCAAFNSWRLPKEEGKRSIRDFLYHSSLLHMVTRVFSSVRDGISYLSQTKTLLDAVLLLTGTQIILGLLATLAPAFADKMLKIDIHDASILIIGPAVVGIIVGSLWVGNFGFRFHPQQLIRVGVTGAGVLLLAIGATVGLRRIDTVSWIFTKHIILPIELVLFFFLGLANSLLDVPANSVLQKEAEGEMRGRVYGVLTAMVGGVGIIPVMVSGILADTIGVGKVIVLLGCGVAAYSVYRIRYSKV